MRKSIALLIGIIVALVTAQAVATTFTTDYQYNRDISYTNESDAAIAQPLLLPINAPALIQYNYIQPDAEDVTIQYLGQEEYITAMNLSGSPSNWRLEHTEIPSGNSVKKTLWFGDPSASRDQRWIAAGSDTATVPCNPGSFQFSGTQSFSIFADIIPATDPGTDQAIFRVGDSYALELVPGPAYKFTAWDSIDGPGSVTVSTSLDTESELMAWWNGPSLQYTLCADQGCETGALANGIAASGSTPVIAECDAVIDNFAVRTPWEWQTGASGTPTAPGTETFLAGPTSVTLGTFYGDDAWAHNFGDDMDALNSYLVNGVYEEEDLWTALVSDSRYKCFLVFYSPNVNTGTLSDDQVLSGVSFNVSLKTASEDDRFYYYVDLEDPYSGKYSQANISLPNVGWNWYSPGTWTLAPNGANWTVDLLKHANFKAIFLATDEVEPIYVGEIRILYSLPNE